MLPMSTALVIFVLLASFNRTINRLTKPVSALIGLSLLSSSILSSYCYFNKIEGELFLSDLLKIFEDSKLVIHLNLFSEKIIIFFSLIMTIMILLSFNKLPRKKGYVSLMIGLGLVTSLGIMSILLVDFSAFI